ncbi:hypothetical protein P3S68_018526 [Capsicum galapagoense]
MKRKGHTGSWGSLVEKKESAEPFNPAWRRKWEEPKLNRHQIHELFNKCKRSGVFRPKFDKYPQNQNLEIYTKSATLKASSSVVSLCGRDAMFQYSGFIIENVDKGSIILTTADLLKSG